MDLDPTSFFGDFMGAKKLFFSSYFFRKAHHLHNEEFSLKILTSREL
jgi:hypothetical protein